MPIDQKWIGQAYGPYTYEIATEKVRDYAFVVGGASPSIGFDEPPPGLSPLLYDPAAARSGPFGSLIALPTFAVTFAIAPFAAAVKDPRLGIDLARLVHGEQDFEFFEPLRPGDRISTTGVIEKIYDKAQLDFVVVKTESVIQSGKLAVRGEWTAVIRR